MKTSAKTVAQVAESILIAMGILSFPTAIKNIPQYITDWKEPVQIVCHDLHQFFEKVGEGNKKSQNPILDHHENYMVTGSSIGGTNYYPWFDASDSSI